MRVSGAALVLVGVLGGCTYYNSIYNAESVYLEAERHRRAGRDSVASGLYEDVIRKAAQGYRREPDGQWAYDALFLLGRAHLRLGDLRAAEAALENSMDLADRPDDQLEALVYLGLVSSANGEGQEAVDRFNRALGADLSAPTLAEGHLHRGRVLLSLGHADKGLWDLGRVSELDPDLRVAAELERFRWGVGAADWERTAESVRSLLSYPEAGERIDTIGGLLLSAEGTWGPQAAAELLGGVSGSSWSRGSRGRLGLERAQMLRRAGDAEGAEDQARDVARGVGVAAGEARLQLSLWRLAEVRDAAEAYEITATLLPSGDRPEVASLIGAIESFEVLSLEGFDDPLAWFAAAEVARDELGSRILARGFFLAYADQVPQDAWAPKALLAALSVSTSEADREWLRGRLEAHSESPYVRAARGEPAAGFEVLEEQLRERLREIKSR